MIGIAGPVNTFAAPVILVALNPSFEPASIARVQAG
ncbi:hypothetical protein BN2476_100031 [Paraburkholderia piptadeniae]|uniref:Uncharacterized protein n=1 Tax=Paraburkholderia piptadeniae TaxID=1701573 RepID=A0A1N7RNN8_9BURK|nr:hypothetical protein BN2476_100031 [Paraburkholderia piptadeniae]